MMASARLRASDQLLPGKTSAAALAAFATAPISICLPASTKIDVEFSIILSDLARRALFARTSAIAHDESIFALRIHRFNLQFPDVAAIDDVVLSSCLPNRNFGRSAQ